MASGILRNLKLFFLFSLLCFPLIGAKSVLIVSDGVPVQILAVQLKSHGINSDTVTQQSMPTKLAAYPAVLVYIHGVLLESAEKAFIDYANSGGKLIVLHHSISSQKRQNHAWMQFLGVSLPEGDVAQGGYKYYDPVRAEYRGEDRDAIELPATEVYVNHVLSGQHTILLGLKFVEKKSGVTYMQDTAGWYKKAGKGWVMYFMAGHSGKEFEDPAYAQILTNAVNFRP